MSTRFRYLLSALSLLILAGSAAAQVSLERFAARELLKSRAARAAADSTARTHGVPVRVTRPDGRVMELQRMDAGRLQYYTTYNLNSAISIATSRVWGGAGDGFALSGAGETVGEWDAGAVRAAHEEFTGRVLSTEGALDDHSTHVAGTLIAAGTVAAAHGMAPGSQLRSFDWNDDLAEMALQAAAGLHVSNHSYGLITGWSGGPPWYWFGDTGVSQTDDYRFGFYDDEARLWDSVAFLAPYYLIVKAAGNDRGEGPADSVWYYLVDGGGEHLVYGYRPPDGGASGYDCLNGAAVAKNVLTVGAVHDVQEGYHGPSSVSMTPFSSWGPTDDGRLKPDVVANGVLLFSSTAWENNAYAWFSGTSMASPSVAGSALLLLEHQRHLHGGAPLRAATLKGLILHTADECGSAPGPDYAFGWGVMNTLAAAELLSRDSLDGPGSHIVESALDSEETLALPLASDGLRPLKVTICWDDPPGVSPAPSVNPAAPALVNDLDLRITRDADGAFFLPWVLDPLAPSVAAVQADNFRDNVEEILISSPVAGRYTLRVTHKGTLAGGSQAVSVIVSGNAARPKGILALTRSPSLFALAPESVTEDSIVIANIGDSATTVSLSLSPDAVLGGAPGIPGLRKTLSLLPAASSGWLATDIDSAVVLPGGSVVVRCTVSAAVLRQWTTHRETVWVSGDDPAQARLAVPLELHVLGPTADIRPPSLTFRVASGDTASDTIVVKNTGYARLYWQCGPADTVVPWMSVPPGVDSVSPGDSLAFIVEVHAGGLPDGTYAGELLIGTNDSLHPQFTIPVRLVAGLVRSVAIGVAGTWNLLSLPVSPADRSRTTLFSDAVSEAFAFHGSYEQHDSLSPGLGYWLKFSQAAVYTVSGTRIIPDTIPVMSGWNLIGSIDVPVAVSSIESEPPGLASSRFYAFNGSYTEADTLFPGRGYWVKVDQDGALILSDIVGSATASGRLIRSRAPQEEPPPPPPERPGRGAAAAAATVLEDAFPNPFNPSTSLRFHLAVGGHVTLTIYNTVGQAVDILIDRELAGGDYAVTWNASALPSGVYWYRLEEAGGNSPAGWLVEQRKLVLLK